MPTKFSRHWAMPNSETFKIPPIRDFVCQYVRGISVDPFARNSKFARHTNDISPTATADTMLDARHYLRQLITKGLRADSILFDPPYSPRQISECYRDSGIDVSQESTQNAVLYSECRKLFRELASPGCVILSFGWNSCGMGNGWITEEIMLVYHGGAHNDTICLAERLAENQRELFQAAIANAQPQGE